jgi:hypothetical protein
MKRVVVVLLCVVAIVLVFGGFMAQEMRFPAEQKKRSCTGYEVIEAGKGINCYGDTIKLTKRSGFYEVAANYPAR